MVVIVTRKKRKKKKILLSDYVILVCIQNVDGYGLYELCRVIVCRNGCFGMRVVRKSGI